MAINATQQQFIDSVFGVRDLADPSKLGQFDASQISAATTRILAFPNASGTIATQEWVDDNFLALDGEGTNVTNGTFDLTTTGLGDFGSLAATTMTGNLTMGGNNITGAGTITANTLTDGTASLTGGNLTGMGNITGTDVDISAGTGDISTTGTLTAGLTTIDSFLFINHSSNTADSAPTIQTNRSRIGPPTAVQNDDLLFRLLIEAIDTDDVDYIVGQIVMDVDGVPSAGVIPSRWEVYTMDASGNLDIALLIDSLQNAYFQEDVNVGGSLAVVGAISNTSVSTALDIHPDCTVDGEGVTFFKNANAPDETSDVVIYGFAKSFGGGSSKNFSMGIDDYARMVFGGTVASVVFNTNLTMGANKQLGIGNAFFEYPTGHGTAHLRLFTHTGFGGTGIVGLMNYDQRDFNFGYPVQLDSELRIHSNDSSQTKYISFTDDGTNGIIATGEGDLNLVPVGNTTIGDGGITNYIQFSTTGNVLLPAGAAAAGRYPIKFQAGTALSTPEAGALEFHDDKLYLTNVATRRAIDRTSCVETSTTTVSNTVVETTIYTCPVPANALKVGNHLHIEVNGIITTATAADDITISVYVGDDLINSYNPAIGNIIAADWHIQLGVTIRTVGGTGTIASHGHVEINGNEDIVNELDSLDTTGANDIVVKVQWDNAKAGNIISLYQGTTHWSN